MLFLFLFTLTLTACGGRATLRENRGLQRIVVHSEKWRTSSVRTNLPRFSIYLDGQYFVVSECRQSSTLTVYCRDTGRHLMEIRGRSPMFTLSNHLTSPTQESPFYHEMQLIRLSTVHPREAWHEVRTFYYLGERYGFTIRAQLRPREWNGELGRQVLQVLSTFEIVPAPADLRRLIGIPVLIILNILGFVAWLKTPYSEGWHSYRLTRRNASNPKKL